ncbi:ATP-grasp fold amidoligase family protein [Candidatus Neomarinimicrobiota bacterium]
MIPIGILLTIECRVILKMSSKKTKMLNNMKSLATILAKDFRYVRVDLYNIDRKIFWGELTFSPSASFEPFYPCEWDRYLGDRLV